MGTAHNRSVTASPPYGGSGYTKTQSGFALCGILLHHILPALVFASQSPHMPAQTSVTARTLCAIGFEIVLS
jgi:hypothetical protein